MGLFNRLRSNDRNEQNERSNQPEVIESAKEPTDIQPSDQPAAVAEQGETGGVISETGREQIVVVEVMPKPEISDPQGKAINDLLDRLGYEGLSVRQGKTFEITVSGELNEDRLIQISEITEKILANPGIETYEINVRDVE